MSSLSKSANLPAENLNGESAFSEDISFNFSSDLMLLDSEGEGGDLDLDAIGDNDFDFFESDSASAQTPKPPQTPAASTIVGSSTSSAGGSGSAQVAPSPYYNPGSTVATTPATPAHVPSMSTAFTHPSPFPTSPEFSQTSPGPVTISCGATPGTVGTSPPAILESSGGVILPFNVTVLSEGDVEDNNNHTSDEGEGDVDQSGNVRNQIVKKIVPKPWKGISISFGAVWSKKYGRGGKFSYTKEKNPETPSAGLYPKRLISNAASDVESEDAISESRFPYVPQKLDVEIIPIVRTISTESLLWSFSTTHTPWILHSFFPPIYSTPPNVEGKAGTTLADGGMDVIADAPPSEENLNLAQHLDILSQTHKGAPLSSTMEMMEDGEAEEKEENVVEEEEVVEEGEVDEVVGTPVQKSQQGNSTGYGTPTQITFNEEFNQYTFELEDMTSFKMSLVNRVYPSATSFSTEYSLAMRLFGESTAFNDNDEKCEVNSMSKVHSRWIGSMFDTIFNNIVDAFIGESFMKSSQSNRDSVVGKGFITLQQYFDIQGSLIFILYHRFCLNLHKYYSGARKE
jgi:hypothetical protein